MALKKSKLFWLFAILLNIAIVSISGYFVYTRLNVHFSNSFMEKKFIPIVKRSFDKNNAADTADKSTVKKDYDIAKQNLPDKPANSVTDRPAKAARRDNIRKKVKALKTGFKYKNAKAKSVSISGSFTRWKKRKMEKKNGIWRSDIWILPGTYLFHYEVDGKKVLDPSKPKAAIDESIVEAGK